MLDVDEVSELKSEISDLQDEIARLQEEVSDLKGEIRDLEEEECDECSHLQAELDEIEDPQIYIDALGEVRRMVARGEYREAVDLADRFLPRSLRYAA